MSITHSVNSFLALDITTSDEDESPTSPSSSSSSPSPKLEDPGTSSMRSMIRGNTKYILTYGNDQTVSSPVPVSGNLGSCWFFGRCYNCRILGHSQKFCPLRYCRVCKAWGHTDNVCSTRHKFKFPPRTAKTSIAPTSYFFDNAER